MILKIVREEKRVHGKCLLCVLSSRPKTDPVRIIMAERKKERPFTEWVGQGAVALRSRAHFDLFICTWLWKSSADIWKEQDKHLLVWKLSPEPAPFYISATNENDQMWLCIRRGCAQWEKSNILQRQWDSHFKCSPGTAQTCQIKNKNPRGQN